MEIFHEIGWRGALDMALMSVLVYAALVGLRRGRSTAALAGLLMVGGLYLTARLLDLQLTVAVLEAFLAVVLVAVIVIFRAELRRFFEQLARWRPTAHRVLRRPAPPAQPLAGVLARVLWLLARQRVGALVVVRGAEPVEQHLEGGVPLDGEVSEPLLASLFDPGSTGHDGAVIIEVGRVSRFACHLPLSTNFAELAGRGTRHAAALGLAERCDALCLVVSEERGEVSVARHGAMRPMAGEDETAGQVSDLLAETAGPQRPLREVLLRDHLMKAAALAVSALLWLVLVHGARSSVRAVEVPVEVEDVDPALLLVSASPPRVSLILTGSRLGFTLTSRRSVRVRISLAGAGAGARRVNLTAADVVLPTGLALRSSRPEAVVLRLEMRPDRAVRSR